MSSHETHEHPHAHPSLGTYLAVFVALLVLLAVTVVAAEIDVGRYNFAVAIAIASVKGLLIMLFFMHVRYSSPLIWLVASAGIYWLMILFGITLGDYLTRGP